MSQKTNKSSMVTTLRDWIRHILQWRWRFAVDMLLYTTGNLLILYAPPLIVGMMVNDFIATGSISLAVAGPYILAAIASWVVGEVSQMISLRINYRMTAEARQQHSLFTLNELLKRDYDFFASNFAGSMTKKSSDYINGFTEFFITVQERVLPELISTIVIAAILYTYNPWLVLLQLGSLLLAAVVSLPIIRWRMRLVRLRQKSSNILFGHIADVITNSSATKAFAEEDVELKTLNTFARDWRHKSVRSWDANNVYLALVNPIYIIMISVALLIAVSSAEARGLQPGDILVIFAYFFQYSQFLSNVGKIYRDVEGQLSKGAEFTELIQGDPAIVDRDDARPLEAANGQIDFTAVDFSYDGDSGLLNDFSLSIPAGQRVGLVGPSGGGKSTLTKLVLRFVDINGGRLEIDGQDVREVTQQSLRRQIAYVPQDPLMFHRSIRDNIAYGKPSASKNEVLAAAKQANAHEFIKQLPGGYDTLVGERGIKLSGGQRQRIAIARAIIKDAPILVLDEATSALDSESEVLIQQALVELMKGRTTLVIAHRLSTIKHLDRVVVMDQGRIVQDGTHAQLSKAKGLYKNLWQHQSDGFIE